MAATSALTDLAPRLAKHYVDLGACHSPPRIDEHCRGCQRTAEAVFIAAMRGWEWFVHNSVLDVVMAVPTSHTKSGTPARKQKYATRYDAEQDFLRSKHSKGKIKLDTHPRQYIVLHNPTLVSALCKFWGLDTPMQRVFDSSGTDISTLLDLRHGLAHGTDEVGKKMQNALRQLEPLRTFATVGEFLVAKPSVTDQNRHLDILLERIMSLAAQISP